MFNNRNFIDYCDKNSINLSDYEVDFDLSIVNTINKSLAKTRMIEPTLLTLTEEMEEKVIQLDDNPENKISKMDFLSDLEQMSRILQDKAIIDSQLEKLEKKLNASSCSLMVLLYEWSIENGFSDKWIRIMHFLDRYQFLNILQKKQLMKDYGPAPIHGEFPHVLQLYIICEYNRENPCLKNSVADIYARMGSIDCRSQIDIFETLWDLILDRRIKEKNPAYDARCPERLMGYIESQRENYPLLSGALRKKFLLRSHGFFIRDAKGKSHEQLFDKKNKIKNKIL